MAGKVAKMFKGKPVYEAKRPLVFHVKENHIRTARRKDPAACAIARCLVGNKIVEGAHIGAHVAYVEYDSHYERYVVPKKEKLEVKKFDKSGAFIEGKYTLLPPSKRESLTGKAHSPVRKKTSGPSGKSGTSVMKRKPMRNIYRSKEKV